MLKMYHQNPHSGDTPDFWANSWDEIDFEEALKQCKKDPIIPLFEKYVKRDSLILEGGCGKGHWVAYFTDRGNKVVGLDFAQRTLVELNTKRDALMLSAGNVMALPFADETFDIYYSGGVVEHFEAGCESALSEARRILKPDGYLLLSVPYYSPMRRLLTPFRRNEWMTLKKPQISNETAYEGLTYFQYAYKLDEFEAMLKNAGLKTIETMGYSVMWGLYDLKFLKNRADAKNQEIRQQIKTQADPVEMPAREEPKSSFAKRLLIGEDTSTLLTKTITNIARWSAANMMMFVCRKN